MKINILCIILLYGLVTTAQDSIRFKKIEELSGSYTSFQVDLLGNKYVLSSNNQLKKLSPRGDSIGVFNDVRRYGKLYSIDATNPLKCLLYYKSFSTIVVLDRFLQPINTIDLRRQSIFQVQAIATSYDNKIWVYDEQNQQLKKVDDNGQVLLSTPDLRMVFDDLPSPDKIMDQDGYVYLYDRQKGVYIFDIYGAFKNKLSYTGFRHFFVMGKTIAGITEDEIVFYAMGTLSEKRAPLPCTNPEATFVVMPNRLYVLRKDKIEVYQYALQ